MRYLLRYLVNHPHSPYFLPSFLAGITWFGYHIWHGGLEEFGIRLIWNPVTFLFLLLIQTLLLFIVGRRVTETMYPIAGAFWSEAAVCICIKIYTMLFQVAGIEELQRHLIPVSAFALFGGAVFLFLVLPMEEIRKTVNRLTEKE